MQREEAEVRHRSRFPSSQMILNIADFLILWSHTATQQMTQWGRNLSGVAVYICILSTRGRGHNKWDRQAKAWKEDNARWQVSYHWKILIYLHWILCEYFMAVYRCDLSMWRTVHERVPTTPARCFSSDYDAKLHSHLYLFLGNGDYKGEPPTEASPALFFLNLEEN